METTELPVSGLEARGLEGRNWNRETSKEKIETVARGASLAKERRRCFGDSLELEVDEAHVSLNDLGRTKSKPFSQRQKEVRSQDENGWGWGDVWESQFPIPRHASHLTAFESKYLPLYIVDNFRPAAQPPGTHPLTSHSDFLDRGAALGFQHRPGQLDKNQESKLGHFTSKDRFFEPLFTNSRRAARNQQSLHPLLLPSGHDTPATQPT
ncbi:hypothetical protein SODALDRAFT_356709 [Sodiomyces alkalinus F11]|uniref:Uncharacterized protein n=1 Tax=Sodiomyces alkalinus (strain CBS 110278 / VKM F-3762 / F11) TaxID=1314773 RepID=A0A3N2Q1W3_SODAK|nr:hypothetical protein SODALDRAFT_356709 [Sodiomyces alkalinus F11]ROT40696.1 hypothetical protein SODALDRAFT_356709 [Sodiomyces alkalinus F11]